MEFTSKFADLYTLATLSAPADCEVEVEVEGVGVFRYESESFAAIVSTIEHPYGDPAQGAVAARQAFDGEAVDPNVAGRWFKI